jgi:hypothetical protein
MAREFLTFKYWHTKKRNVRDKGTWSQEELDQSTNAWAKKFVHTNLRSQLASWLRKLDNLFPEELPFGTSRVRRSSFTAMAVSTSTG